MKNLYAPLGFDRIIEDPNRLAEALARLAPQHPEVEQIQSVLGDPVRKAHYDWVLCAALKLALSRQRLGLRADPFLPRPDSWGIAPVLPVGTSSGNWTPMNWLPAVGLGALVLSLVAFWTVSTPPATAHATAPPVPEIRRPTADPQSEEAAPKKREPETHNPEIIFPGLELVTPPGHGTLQMESGSELRIFWQVTTVYGQDYFLILSDAQTQHRVLTLYLHGGEPFRGMIPEGDFSLAYTSGFYWYGPQHRFGPGSRMLKADRPFRVVQGPDNSTAWELNLRPASGSDPLFTPDDSSRDMGR